MDEQQMSKSLTVPQPYQHVMRHVKERPNEIALATADTQVTYADLYGQSKQIAGYLRVLGIKPGQLVATLVPPTLTFILRQALLHEAAISCAWPQHTTPDPELGIDWLLTTVPVEGFPAEKTIMVNNAWLARANSYGTDSEPNMFPDNDAIIHLIFSSGTTGRPKAIPFSINTIERRSNVAHGYWMSQKPFMCILPQASVSGFQTAYANLVNGEPYLRPGSPAENAAIMRKYRVASVKASPAQLKDLVDYLRANPKINLSLKLVQSAGSYLPPKLAADIRETTGAEIHNLYGSSEAGTVSIRVGSSEEAADTGKVVPEATVQIVDEDDNPLPITIPGIVRYKRPFQSTEYFRNPEATAQSFRDGWFYPGDTGWLTEDGHLWLSGRTSELINAGGTKIDPASVDAYLIGQKEIEDAAGFGYEDESGFVKFGIAIVPRKKRIDLEEIRKRFNAAFQFKAPDEFFIVETIPRNPSGKVIRRDLATAYQKALQK